MKNVLAATIYNLWIEMNQRIFRQKALTKDHLVLKTVSCIQEALSLKRGVLQSQINRDLSSSWGLRKDFVTLIVHKHEGTGCIAFSLF